MCCRGLSAGPGSSHEDVANRIYVLSLCREPDCKAEVCVSASACGQDGISSVKRRLLSL